MAQFLFPPFFFFPWPAKAIRRRLFWKRTSLIPTASPLANAFTLSKQFSMSSTWNPMRCTHAYFWRMEKRARNRMRESVLNYLKGLFFSRKGPDLGSQRPPVDMDSHPSVSCFLYVSCPSINLEVMIDAMSPPASSLRGILHSSSIGISSQPPNFPSTLSCSRLRSKCVNPLADTVLFLFPSLVLQGRLHSLGLWEKRTKRKKAPIPVWNIRFKNALSLIVLSNSKWPFIVQCVRLGE